MTTEEPTAVRDRIPISSELFNSLYMKPVTKIAYTTATAPASVGVNTPKRMPTSIMIGKISARIEFFVSISAFLNENDPSPT